MLGGYSKQFWLMVLGRFLFGFGCETLWVVQMIYIVDWFFDLELAFAMGMGGFLSNMTSFASGYFVPRIYDKDKNLGDAFLGGTIFSIICVAIAIVLAIIEKKTFAEDVKQAKELA